MKTLDRLTLAAYGMHIADQIALVAVPLIAALVFKAAPETIGLLVACQAMAHLVASIPAGVIVDRLALRNVTIGATVLSLFGFAGVAVSIWLAELQLFAVTVLLAGCGIVLFVLAALSILPRVTAPHALASANAKIEIPRAAASFAVPLAVGVLLDGESAKLVFICATLCALGAFIVTLRLPPLTPPPNTTSANTAYSNTAYSNTATPKAKQALLAEILEGGSLVLRHPLLRPIAACAVFWNLAFAALLVVMVPLLLEHFRADAGNFGIALSAFGGAAIAGSWLSGRTSNRISPNVILLFGPGSSVLAIFALLSIPADGPVAAIHACFFLLGFGPAMWLIAQNAIRQLVTPPRMLGRVNAVIQTAIYGVRPLGALLGGVIAGATSPRIGLTFVALAFAASLAAALFSRLRAVRRYEDLRAEAGA